MGIPRGGGGEKLQKWSRGSDSTLPRVNNQPKEGKLVNQVGISISHKGNRSDNMGIISHRRKQAAREGGGGDPKMGHGNNAPPKGSRWQWRPEDGPWEQCSAQRITLPCASLRQNGRVRKMDARKNTGEKQSRRLSSEEGTEEWDFINGITSLSC